MKKILFLTFNYPYGHFGPSDLCSTKIMDALVKTGKFEVHNVSYSGTKKSYADINGVHLHMLGFPEKQHKRPDWLIRLLLLLKTPIYPYTQPLISKKVYRACVPVLQKENFDLVIAQCNPEESLRVGVWLKKNNLANKLVVIFWDSIYGKLPRRVIPKRFALRRQYKSENEIAKYTDVLISLYPLRAFHEEYGDVPNAIGKREYLGIPSVIRPEFRGESNYKYVIKQDEINCLYSGTIFRREYVTYLVELLNRTTIAERINLIFFCRGVGETDFEECRKNFRGTIQSSGWIPLNDLLSLYPMVDYFLSFPGNPTAIRSKVYEYMSYGKPLILLYDDDNDVNVSTFSKYPACIALDERCAVDGNAKKIEPYIIDNKKMQIPFEDVEELFPRDTVSYYVKLIDKIVR